MNCCFYLAIDRLPAGHGGGDRVPAGDRARRARRALARATPPRSRSPSPASTCSPACTSRASRSASRSRSPTRGCSPPTSCSPTASRQRPGDRRHRRARGGDADRARRGHADGRAGRRCPPSPTRSRSLAGIGVGISSSVIPYVADQVAMARLTRAAYALMVSLLPGDRDRRRPDRAHAGAVGRPTRSGIALVIAGVALHREPTPPPDAPPSPPPRPSPAATPIPAASGSHGRP